MTVEQAVKIIGQKGNCITTYAHGVRKVRGDYKKNGQFFSFRVEEKGNATALCININGMNFGKDFRGADRDEEIGTELVKAFRYIDGAAKFFRDYKKG